MNWKEEKPEKYLLYAEDDSDDQEIMREMIAEIDPKLEVITVNDGLNLYHFLSSLEPESNYPCIIILDVNMPLWDGLKTLQVLKNDEHLQKIPVVMFSTSNSKKDAMRALEMGAQSYIVKPIHTPELEKVVKQFAEFCHAVPLKVKQ